MGKTSCYFLLLLKGSRNGGSAMLQKVELNLVPPEKCNVSYRAHIPNELPNGIHPDYMLCAGGHDGKDTCQVLF